MDQTPLAAKFTPQDHVTISSQRFQSFLEKITLKNNPRAIKESRATPAPLNHSSNGRTPSTANGIILSDIKICSFLLTRGSRPKVTLAEYVYSSLSSDPPIKRVTWTFLLLCFSQTLHTSQPHVRALAPASPPSNAADYIPHVIARDRTWCRRSKQVHIPSNSPD